MTELDKSGGAGQDNVGGADDSVKNPSGDNENNSKKDSVAFETYDRLLGEKKKMQDALKAEREKNKQYEDNLKSQSEKELAEKEEWKKLLAIREKELEEANSKLTTHEKQTINARKIDSVLKTMDGEVSDKYWIHFDLDSIAIDPETNKVDEMTVAAEVERFRKEHPMLVRSRSRQKSGLPNEAPGKSSRLTHDQWRKLPAKEMRERLKDVYNPNEE